MPDWPLAVARSVCRARGLLTQRQAQHIWSPRIFCCLVVGRLAASYQWRRSWEHAIESGPFLWGIPGAFIGVPATIAMLTMCAQYAGSRWLAVLLSDSASRK